MMGEKFIATRYSRPRRQARWVRENMCLHIGFERPEPQEKNSIHQDELLLSRFPIGGQ